MSDIFRIISGGASLRAPSPNQIIHGKRRGDWVKDAARAVIASTDAALLWKIVRVGGLLEFARVARPEFSKQAGFDFTMDEIRWIFDFLDEHVTALERENKAREFVSTLPDVNFEVDEKGDGRIVTASLKGGERVH